LLPDFYSGATGLSGCFTRDFLSGALTHLSLDKDAPGFRQAQKFGRIAAIPIIGALHHQYVRI